MLKIVYFGKTSFVLEYNEMKVLLNPGIWGRKKVVPNDFSARIVIATNQSDDAVGNSANIAVNSKAWFLGNQGAADKASKKGVKPWLLHVLKPEVPYEIPDLKITPYALSRIDEAEGGRIENLGLYIEIGDMKVGYLGDSVIRGPFEQLDMDILIVPVGGDGVFPVKDAVSLCIDAQPRVGIPMRWSSVDDPLKFSKYVQQFGQGTVPVVMAPNQVLEVYWAAGNEFKYELN
ncbi:MAG: MBL fold metallo-hydrolase [Candidatus Thorarchaeota archaeon]